jgi:hypothetical protein
MTADRAAAGFYPSDDPRAYRHPSNRNPGQPNAALNSTANHWLRGRIRLEKRWPFTYITPEVYIETGERTVDPATGVPKAAGGEWIRLYNARTRYLQQRRVISAIPFSAGRLARGIKEIASLFKARAIVPAIVAEEGIEVPESVKEWIAQGAAPSYTTGKLPFVKKAS